MVANFDSVQQIGKEQFEAVSAAAAAVTKGWQNIAAETTDYSKKSFEKSRLLAEKLITVKKLTLNPPKWSSFSSIQLRESDKGPWRVEINNENGDILKVLRFSITE